MPIQWPGSGSGTVPRLWLGDRERETDRDRDRERKRKRERETERERQRERKREREKARALAPPPYQREAGPLPFVNPEIGYSGVTLI